MNGGFRELRVWQQAMDMVEMIYRVTRGFPKEETYGLVSQMRRAAVSVPANIAEGNCRAHIREYLNFLSVAQGSVAELETHAEIAGRLKYASAEDLAAAAAQISSIGRQLRALRQAMNEKSRTAAAAAAR
ncbi:MAG TPA: four helix bundle protein [Bryobacteraceae bacterium]|nr:four helix bundle protein [Bryobacteraceae bacterium]